MGHLANKNFPLLHLLMSLNWLADGPLKEVVSHMDHEGRVALFSTNKKLRERMVYAGCLEFFHFKYPSRKIWFFDYIQCITTSTLWFIPSRATSVTLWEYHSGKREFSIPLPESITEFTLTGNGVYPLDKLPRSLTKLHINQLSFEQPIRALPPNLKELRIHVKAFDRPIDKLPYGLTYLEICSVVFDRPLDYLPETLVCLRLSCETFSQRLDKLPTQLKRLYLVHCNQFFHPLDDLPVGLESLEIEGGPFNHPVSNLPCDLRYLGLIHLLLFDQPLDYLPHGLTTLCIYLCPLFNQAVDDLPMDLKSLTIYNCDRFNQPIDKLPARLDKLDIIYCSAFTYPKDHLPKTLSKVNVEYKEPDHDPYEDHVPLDVRAVRAILSDDQKEEFQRHLITVVIICLILAILYAKWK